MLRGALKEHERKTVLPAQRFAADPPAPVPPRSSVTSFMNGAPRSPLKPVAASTVNGQGSPTRSRSVAGVKRTSSGLAKAMSGTFDDGAGTQHLPIVLSEQSPAVKGRYGVDFDENDFDSDIELDMEEPLPKQNVTYPKLPVQASSNISFKPTAYPVLPQQTRAQPNSPRGFSTATSSGHRNMQAAPAKQEPSSSAPWPWSSSPLEHHNSAMPPPSLQRFSYDAPKIDRAATVQSDALNKSRPAKRRVLPWPKAEGQSQQLLNDQSATHVPQTKMQIKPNGSYTPLPKDSKKSQYPWNTTASAIKEQQKQHREEAKKEKAVKKLDATDESVRKAKSANKRPAKVFLSEEQQHVLDLVIEKKKSVFFTGSAGTGKSVLMREIIASLRRKYIREPDRVAVTASTGLAACNVGGVTLHSFAGIGLGKEDVPELVRKIKRNQKAKHRWLRTKVLIVDEVSMVDGELFDKLEAIARQIRNNARPFGGIQIVITGDFFQLPPVPDSSRVAKFAFDAATWKTSIEHTIGLHHVFRQKDPSMLNEMREGRLSQSSINAFRKLSRPLNFEDMLDATELFPTRAEVDRANTERLRMLQGESVPFMAKDGGSLNDKTMRDRLLANCMAPEAITLKKGAQVMLIKNVDETLVNGSIGRVIGFLSEREFDSYINTDNVFPQSPGGTLQSAGSDAGSMSVTSAFTTTNRWPLVRFAIQDGTWRDLLCQPEPWKVELPSGEVQASRSQVPLILAWALSIHKAQGQTLERVKVDLGKVFEKGQAYVALSRATSMAGLQVLRFDPKVVNAHEKVRTFYSNLSRVELAEKNKERMDSVKKTGTAGMDYESRFMAGDVDEYE